MDEKLTKLIELGKSCDNTQNDMKALQKFVEQELSLSDISDILDNTLWTQEGIYILGYIFGGLTLTLESQKKRMKIIDIVVTEMQKRDLTNKTVVNITSKLAIELSKIKTQYLVKICKLCVDAIGKSESASRTSWKELLPVIINLLSDKKQVNMYGMDMTGAQCTQEIIQQIRSVEWKPEIMVPLASMFTEIPLDKGEHEKIVKKLCSNMDEMDVQELPPFIHHLLRICKNEHGVIVFLYLRNYFAKFTKKENNSFNQDSIEDGYGGDISEIQTTILCHIEDIARVSRQHELVKICRNTINVPDMILEPFMLALLLTISCIPAYESQIMEIVRNMIVHSITDDVRKSESAWCRQMAGSFNLDSVFVKLIQSKIGEHGKVAKGMINLSFVLLATNGQKGKEQITKKVWRIGRFVLVALVKKQRFAADTVLKQLKDRIIAGSKTHQYTDCLLYLCNSTTLTMIDNKTVLVRILEFIHCLHSSTSQRIITALIPLIQSSHALRDNIVLTLRKALFSREITVKQTAVFGFLQLLKFLKLDGLSSFSQNCMSQGPGVFTQMCIDVHSQEPVSKQRLNINEAICLEVIGVLKRCFSQQALVKLTLYKGLGNAVGSNTELCITILDVLLDHFSQYYVHDELTPLPLDFTKIVVIRGAEAVLQEPMGRLLFLIQNVLMKSVDQIRFFNDDNDSLLTSFNKFNRIFHSLIDRFSKCDLNHFQLDESTNLTEILPEHLQTQENVRQILSTYEALMAYIINSWTVETNATEASNLIELHKCYRLVFEFAKNSGKSGKKKGEAAEKKEKKEKKDKELILPKKTPFKFPKTILDFETIERMLSVFLSNDDLTWCLPESINELKINKPFMKYATYSCLEAVKEAKALLAEEQRSNTQFKKVSEIATLLFNNLCQFHELLKLDEQVGVICLECFTEIISLIVTYYNSKLQEFLKIVTKKEETIDTLLLWIITQLYKPLLKIIMSDFDFDNDDADDLNREDLKKVFCNTFLDGLQMVITSFSPDNSITNQVTDWLLSTCEKKSLTDVNHSKKFVDLLLLMLEKCKTDFTVLDCLTAQIVNLFPCINESTSEETKRPLLMVSDSNKHAVHLLLCNRFIHILDSADWIIARMKSKFYILPYENDLDDTVYDQLCKEERELCVNVSHVILMTKSICSAEVVTGPCVECVLKLLTRTYTTLCLLTKYFTIRSSEENRVYQKSRFKNLVMLGGKDLSDLVSEVIQFIEQCMTEKKVSTVQLSGQIRKHTIIVPKLVAELENFTKLVTVLGKKCKDTSLLHNLKLTSTRDFRLNVQKIEKVLKQNSEDEETEDQSSRINDTAVEPPKKKMKN